MRMLIHFVPSGSTKRLFLQLITGIFAHAVGRASDLRSRDEGFDSMLFSNLGQVIHISVPVTKQYNWEAG